MNRSYLICCPACQQLFEMTEAYHLGAVSYCSDSCRQWAHGDALVDSVAGTPDSHEAGETQANDGIWFPQDERRQMQ